MALASGDLDRRLTLLRPVRGESPTGGEIIDYHEAGTVWAGKRDVSDAERVKAEQVGSTLTTRFVVRWSSLTTSLASGWQVKTGGVRYAVTGVKEIGRREGREITATALAEPVAS